MRIVQPLLAEVGMPRLAGGEHGSTSFSAPSDRSVRPMVLGLEFHGDLEFWRWFVDKRLTVCVGGAPCRRPRTTLI